MRNPANAREVAAWHERSLKLMDASREKPRVLVFEWMVGGGLLLENQPLQAGSSMFRQGAEMRRAISED